MENLTNDTPPKKGFWTPPRTVRFPPPSGVSPLFFLYKNPQQSRPEALLDGSKNFRESAFSGTFSSPHTFCTPPYHGPIFTAPLKIARFFEASRCAISSAKKIASELRFLLRIKWVKVVLAAEFPAIPSLAAKIASERRCAILVHSGIGALQLA